MDYHSTFAQIDQIMALNDEMLKNRRISRDGYDIVRGLQVKKLKNLHGRSTIKEKTEALL